MREIKFRAFIKELITMHAVLELYHDGGVMVDGYEYPLKSGSIFLMQYTGLKDKNGVEIYEGDIVKSENGGSAVEYIECIASFDFGLSNYVSCQEHGIESSNLEVVGNIYQAKVLKAPN